MTVGYDTLDKRVLALHSETEHPEKLLHPELPDPTLVMFEALHEYEYWEQAGQKEQEKSAE